MHFPAGGKEVQWSERHGLTLGGAKLLKTSFPRFKTSFMQIGRCYLYRTMSHCLLILHMPENLKS